MIVGGGIERAGQRIARDDGLADRNGTVRLDGHEHRLVRPRLLGRGAGGRLTPISTVASGAATMKMISSTRMTSMNGVTLISCWTSRSSPPEREPRRIAMAFTPPRAPAERRGPVSAADHQEQLRRGVAEQRAVAADDADQMVVDHDRGDRGDEADRGGEQRLGDAGRDHREIGGVGFRDADERVHDAPHRAEQADERRGGADRRQHADAARNLPRHRRFDALQPQRDALLETVVDDAAGQLRFARRRQDELRDGIGVAARKRVPRRASCRRLPASLSRRRATCLRARSSMVLASQTVQVTSEAKASPTITAFTTMSALRNMPHGDRLRGSSGFASWANAGSAVIVRQARKLTNLATIPLHSPPPGSCFLSLCHMWSSLIVRPPVRRLHSFWVMPAKKPRRGPNCGAKTPMPEPSLIS